MQGSRTTATPASSSIWKRAEAFLDALDRRPADDLVDAMRSLHSENTSLRSRLERLEGEIQTRAPRNQNTAA